MKKLHLGFLHYSYVILCGSALCLLSACQQEETLEPPLQAPAPLGQQVRLFQQQQIDKARRDAATHTVPADDAGSVPGNASSWPAAGNGSVPASAY